MMERDVEALLVRRVRELGGKTIKLAPTETGVPDRLVIWPGGPVHLVEVKALGGRLSKAQINWHDRLREKQGVRVHVLYGPGDVEMYVQLVKEIS